MHAILQKNKPQTIRTFLPIILSVCIVIGIGFGYFHFKGSVPTASKNQEVSQLTVPHPSVVEALDQAINDEYKAHETYASILEKFGDVRPFANIIKAEEQHISMLKDLYLSYGLVVPNNEWVGKIPAPDSIESACSLGVEAEIENVSLYRDTLLPAVSSYTDISEVFTNLMNASQTNHLPAFQRCAR